MSQQLEFILHPPWWAALFVVIVGSGIFFWASRRLDRTLIRVGLVLILIGVLMGIVGWAFPSARQQMESRTKAMVTAINDRDWQKLQSNLNLNTTVATPSTTIISGIGNIVKMTREVSERFGVHSASVLRISSQRTETLITVNVTVYSEQDLSGGHPTLSTLQLDFAQADKDWVLQTITILSVDEHSGDEVANHLR